MEGSRTCACREWIHCTMIPSEHLHIFMQLKCKFPVMSFINCTQCSGCSFFHAMEKCNGHAVSGLDTYQCENHNVCPIICSSFSDNKRLCNVKNELFLNISPKAQFCVGDKTSSKEPICLVS